MLGSSAIGVPASSGTIAQLGCARLTAGGAAVRKRPGPGGAAARAPLRRLGCAAPAAPHTAGAPKSRTIDYKRTIYGNAHADHSEFLADASSFANTSGGDLVTGMDATNGIPTAITPLTVPMDPEILRLEPVARGGLQPRIANIAFHTVSTRAGGNVLIIRVPRSYNPPHRIIRQGQQPVLGTLGRREV
jgi:hypothetical protein